MNKSDILDIIGAHKQKEISAAKKIRPAHAIEQAARSAPAVRPFSAALRQKAQQQIAVIAELKKASPSKGLIRAEFDPAALARDCAQGGAACLSVLTDQHFFQGKTDDLTQARAACSLPVLRKDFFYDVWQIAEARALGADCVLLIMRALDDGQAAELAAAAQDWGMDVLPEVHDEHELERALALNTQLIGINNRDLKTFTTDLAITRRLAPLVPPDRLVICESGIAVRADIDAMLNAPVHAFLIGETLMREANVKTALQKLIA